MVRPKGAFRRQAHTKSRMGCKTCKRKHMKCDEGLPQCRNCLGRGFACEYTDPSMLRATASKIWKPSHTPTATARRRKLEPQNGLVSSMSGPSGFLQRRPRGEEINLSEADVELYHLIFRLAVDLCRRQSSHYTIWVPEMLKLFSIGLSHDFVMRAILAFSASHLAFVTCNKDTLGIAYYHRDYAVKGLQGAINTFSNNNYEAVLAASVLLSWQATEWQSWTTLQQGIATVLDAVPPICKQKSDIAELLESRKALHHSVSSTKTTHRFPSEELINADLIVTNLQNAQKLVADNEQVCRLIDELSEYVRNLRDAVLVQNQHAFRHAKRLREWLFWLAPAMLRDEKLGTRAPVILAQFYSVAIIYDSAFPHIGGAYLGSLSIDPIIEIYQTVEHQRELEPLGINVQLSSLMSLPYEIANRHLGCESRPLQWHDDCDSISSSNDSQGFASSPVSFVMDPRTQIC